MFIKMMMDKIAIESTTNNYDLNLLLVTMIYFFTLII